MSTWRGSSMFGQNTMKSNQLLQGFYILLLASCFVMLIEGLTQKKQLPAVNLVQNWEDTLIQAATPVEVYVKDSLLVGEESWEDEQEKKAEPEVIQHKNLGRFFAALDRVKVKNGKARVAYFGDSMIEGDLVTESLRNDLQEIFGGTGVGFVPLTSKTYGFRKTIKHRFAEEWKNFNLLSPNPTKHPFGISGEFFLTGSPSASEDAWVRYETTDAYQRTQIFEQVRMYFGQRIDRSGTSPYVIVTNNDESDTLRLRDNQLVNAVTLSRKPTEEIELHFSIPEDLPVYGLSFESESGVFLDNYSSRGNSGMNLVQIPSVTLKEFYGHLEYDLVVLHFGLNVVSTQRKSFKSYERGMKNVIRHFQKFMPNTDILMVSVSDKSTKIDGKLQTDPSVPLIVEAQRRVAEEMNVAFIDLYRSMGGRNSMIRWVHANPSLARSDYTHPNRRGAAKVGSIIKLYLMKEYEDSQNPKGQKAFASRQPLILE